MTTLTKLHLDDRDQKREEARIARYAAFDKLVSDWMAAHAEYLATETDEQTEVAHEKQNGLFWKIIRARSPLPRHTQDKFTVLLLDMGADDRLFRDYGAMIESIRADIDQGFDSLD